MPGKSINQAAKGGEEGSGVEGAARRERCGGIPEAESCAEGGAERGSGIFTAKYLIDCLIFA